MPPEPSPPIPDSVIASVLVLLALSVVVGLIMWIEWRDRRRQRLDRDQLLGLLDDDRFEPVSGEAALAAVAERIDRAFRFMAMYARQLHILAALRREEEAFTLEVVHAVMGLERSNANHHTLDKLVVLFRPMPERLATFLLMPSSKLARQFHPNAVFEPGSHFSNHNLVLGTDRAAIKHALSREVRRLLIDNRDLCILSSGDMLAMYLHDERVQPENLNQHVDRCVQLAQLIAETVATPMTDLQRRLALLE